MSLVGCHLVTAGWDEWSTVLEMLTICGQRSFVEAGMTMKGSFAEDKEGVKLRVKRSGLGELQKK